MLIYFIIDINLSSLKILSPIDKLDDNVNVSSALRSTCRILYPKLAKKCKSDMLLARRMQLKLAEEKEIIAKNQPQPPVEVFIDYKTMTKFIIIKHVILF